MFGRARQSGRPRESSLHGVSGYSHGAGVLYVKRRGAYNRGNVEPQEDRRIIEGLWGDRADRIMVRKSTLHMTEKEPSYDIERAPVTASSRTDSGRAAGASRKIVLLHGGGPRPRAQPPGTSELRLDLQAPIDKLRSIRGDLELYYWERPGHGEQHERERYQVSLWIRQVSERTAALQG